MNPTLVTRGAISLSNCNLFVAIEAGLFEKPVIFPPGRASSATKTFDDRVGSSHENDWDGLCEFLERSNGKCAS